MNTIVERLRANGTARTFEAANRIEELERALQVASNNMTVWHDEARRLQDLVAELRGLVRQRVNDALKAEWANKPPAPSCYNRQDEIKYLMNARAPWYGRCPRRSKIAHELGQYMDPERFDTLSDFVNALIGYVEEIAPRPLDAPLWDPWA